MPTVALLSRVTAEEGKGEKLIAAFKPVFELAHCHGGNITAPCNAPESAT
jgi:hypothetical protein